MYAYIYIYIYIYTYVCEPLSCDPAAEIALHPLIWCSESLSSRRYSYPEECFFMDTGSRSGHSRSGHS